MSAILLLSSLVAQVVTVTVNVPLVAGADNAPALQRAVDTATKGTTVTLSAGEWSLGSPLRVNKRLAFTSSGCKLIANVNGNQTPLPSEKWLTLNRNIARTKAAIDRPLVVKIEKR